MEKVWATLLLAGGWMPMAVLQAQTAADKGPTEQSAAVPAWQIVAGGKKAFEVASVRPSQGPFRPPNFPLDEGDAYAATGGRFNADFPLSVYIQFAYKIRLTQEQLQSLLAQLPKWVATDRFSIQARAEGTPTKDQMRLMMQSLLADRFQLAVHFESRQVTVLALTLVKSSKTGPKLRPHAEGPSCDDSAGPAANGSPPSVFPARCDVYALMVKPDRSRQAGSRNTTMDLLASSLPSLGSLGRPVLDQTGLTGRFDFVLEWTPEANSPPLTDTGVASDPQGPTFLQALHDQLGLKLEATNGRVQILVVDHVERPSEN
ncbi:MAG TPA: TIGR03435 family protein [Bryobacteraceae bacterium]|nr:TIGR03435 family protein [Bryobacteraceae bacterium]